MFKIIFCLRLFKSYVPSPPTHFLFASLFLNILFFVNKTITIYLSIILFHLTLFACHIHETETVMNPRLAKSRLIINPYHNLHDSLTLHNNIISDRRHHHHRHHRHCECKCHMLVIAYTIASLDSSKALVSHAASSSLFYS